MFDLRQHPRHAFNLNPSLVLSCDLASNIFDGLDLDSYHWQ
jgi:hypothetical protein